MPNATTTAYATPTTKRPIDEKYPILLAILMHSLADVAS
jgi:hypothetical protein